MVYVIMFDFALAALVVAGLAFFVWCWIAFRQERIQHPIYPGFVVPVVQNAAATQVIKRCA